jgi:hypothetical protein
VKLVVLGPVAAIVNDRPVHIRSRAAVRQYPAKVKLPTAGPLLRLATAQDAREWLNAELANLVSVVETGVALSNPDAVWRLVFACRPFCAGS